MKCNYVNADHIHTLIDLPANLTIQDAVKLLKGASSHWINRNELVPGRFAWGRGYGAFSLSHSGISKLVGYIDGQDEHHRAKSFEEEFAAFIKAYEVELEDAGGAESSD